MNTFFSIIIPARSNNEYLAEDTFPSIENQSFKDFEVVVIADDPESFYHQKKLYPWLKVIESDKPPGMKRDIGANSATGQILAFIDDDAAPHRDWLKNANRVFSENDEIVAVGGPGILPENAGFWEKTFDYILCSWLGSGGYSYRFQAEKERKIDDYPSMNLLIKTDVFLSLDGFGNKYWPGEDSKLGEKLNKVLNKKIHYIPDVVVYHHRRDELIPYLKQHWRYGFMRGLFFAHGDSNSMRAAYLMPFLLLVYLVVYIELVVAAKSLSQNDIVLYSSIPLLIYALSVIVTGIQIFIKCFNPLLFLSVIVILPLTHLIYGVGFAAGYTSDIIKRREKAVDKLPKDNKDTK